MHIGIAGPVSLGPLDPWLVTWDNRPKTYSFPLIGQIAANLLQRGHRVTVFAGGLDIARTVAFKKDALEVIVTPWRCKNAAYDFYREERKNLCAVMDASSCDIIHAHWTYEFAAAAQQSGKPTLVTAHDAPLAIQKYFITTRAAVFWLMRMGLGAKVIRNAAMLTAVSPYVARHIEKWFHPRCPVQVIPNGIPDDLFTLGENRLETHVRANAPATGDTKPFIIASILEGFGKRKNATTGIAAFARFHSKEKNSRLRMYGADFGPDGPAEKWARERGLSDGIEFRGFTPHEQLMRETNQEGDLLLHPALEEAHPMAICEAMALGVPVLGGIRSGGVPFTLDNGNVGFLTDVSNSHAIADSLGRLHQNREGLVKKSGLAWEYASKEYRLSIMMNSYEKAYRQLYVA